jgi:hypothetical protein
MIARSKRPSVAERFRNVGSIFRPQPYRPAQYPNRTIRPAGVIPNRERFPSSPDSPRPQLCVFRSKECVSLIPSWMRRRNGHHNRGIRIACRRELNAFERPGRLCGSSSEPPIHAAHAKTNGDYNWPSEAPPKLRRGPVTPAIRTGAVQTVAVSALLPWYSGRPRGY